jgi:hypothetical protein
LVYSSTKQDLIWRTGKTLKSLPNYRDEKAHAKVSQKHFFWFPYLTRFALGVASTHATPAGHDSEPSSMTGRLSSNDCLFPPSLDRCSNPSLDPPLPRPIVGACFLPPVASPAPATPLLYRPSPFSANRRFIVAPNLPLNPPTSSTSVNPLHHRNHKSAGSELSHLGTLRSCTRTPILSFSASPPSAVSRPAASCPSLVRPRPHLRWGHRSQPCLSHLQRG